MTKDGDIEFFECGLKSDDGPAYRKRFYNNGGEDGLMLCSSEGDPTQHDFGCVVVDKGVRYFESHLKGDDDGPRGLLP